MTRARIVLFGLIAVLFAGFYYFSLVNPITGHLQYGLDFVGGISVEFQAEPTPGAPVDQTAMNRVLEILNYRVDQMGVSGPTIQQVGSNRVLIQVPGVKNQEAALKELGQTAVLQIKTPNSKTVLVSGSELSSATAAIANGQYVVDLTFNPAGTKAFAAATKKYLGKPLPIYLNGKLVEAPTVDDVITNGSAQLSGNFTSLGQAQKTALLLAGGALPVSLKVLDLNLVSATLGKLSIHASEVAAAIAVVLIWLFMIFWYRLAGLLADIALALYMFLLIGAMWALGATITLPGVAGMILSAGMAVDANVIIFSRVKEEMVAGKTPRAAIEQGFRHAIRAILDSNATTFLAAFILFELGSGEVKGFAITLMAGIAISLFTAVLVTRTFIRLTADAGWARVRAIFVG